VQLSELETFILVADELHFGRAAQRAHLSQPALTQRIQRLERDLGFPLFTRDRRRVTLTPAGAALLERTRRLLAEAEAMVTSARRVSAGLAGSLRIGYVGSALYGALPPVLSWLADRAPELDVTLVEHKTPAQLDMLEARRLDAGFVHLPNQPLSGFHVVDLGVEPRVLALPARHALAARKRVPLVALADEPIVLFPREAEPDAFDGIAKACADAGFSPRVAQEAVSVQTMIGLVAAGLGVAFVAASIASGMRRTGVVFRPLTPAVLQMTNAVIWPTEHDNPAITELASAVEACRAVAQS
jgi:DNA-binding transcriptional LysR family regulator